MSSGNPKKESWPEGRRGIRTVKRAFQMRKRHWFFWLEKALQRPASLYGFSWEPSRRERGRRSRRGVRGVWIEGERRSGGIRKNKSTHQRDPISCRFLSLPPPPPLPKTCRFCDGHVFFSITRVSPVIWLKAAGNGRNSTRDRNKWHCFRPRGEREITWTRSLLRTEATFTFWKRRGH